MNQAVGRAMWIAGAPARVLLLTLIRIYRATLSGLAGGRCRFYPSCSSYAEHAIRHAGAARGTALAVWRILRCSPLSKGGVDYPPGWRGVESNVYDGAIHEPAHALGGGREATPA